MIDDNFLKTLQIFALQFYFRRWMRMDFFFSNGLIFCVCFFQLKLIVRVEVIMWWKIARVTVSNVEHCRIDMSRGFMLTLKSNISANIYGPPCVNVRLGFMISDSMTESSPYLLRNSLAHSMPSCPNPPVIFNIYCSTIPLRFEYSNFKSNTCPLSKFSAYHYFQHNLSYSVRHRIDSV